MGPEPRGHVSAAWHALLRSDCPACAWWHEQRPTPEEQEALSALPSGEDLTLLDTQQASSASAPAAASPDTQELLRDLDVPQVRTGEH